MRRFEAVLFDFGGVFTPSPFDIIRAGAEELGIDPDVAFRLCFGPYDDDTDHPWHRMERGEIALEHARTELIALAAGEGHDLDPFALLGRMGREVDEQVDVVVERTRALKERGYKTAVVTNNIKEFGDGWRRMVPTDELFDAIVDSSAEGVRKPDPRIYLRALEVLGVTAEHTVFIDDAAANVAAAEALGMAGIVVTSDRIAAMDRLERLLEL